MYLVFICCEIPPIKNKNLVFISGRWVCWNIKKGPIQIPPQKSQKAGSVVEAPQRPGRFITGRFVPHSEIWVSSTAWKLHCSISRPRCKNKPRFSVLSSMQQPQQLFARRRSNPVFIPLCLSETQHQDAKDARRATAQTHLKSILKIYGGHGECLPHGFSIEGNLPKINELNSATTKSCSYIRSMISWA